MFPSLPLSQGRRAAARFAGLPAIVCLIVAYLCAGFVSGAGAAEKHPAAEDSAPGRVPKVNYRTSSDTPCPKNITPETWAQSFTLWRWVYERCKPEGAPERYAYTQEDLKVFLLRNPELFNGVMKDCELLFDEWAPNICRISLIFPDDTIPVYAAKLLTASIVTDTLAFLRFNGRSPGGESMLIAVRAFGRQGGETKNMYSIYDIETGSTLFSRTNKWK